MHGIENRSASRRATAFEAALVVMLLAAALSASVLGDDLTDLLDTLIANFSAF